MKKGITIILAVAIIGALGMYAKSPEGAANTLVSRNTGSNSSNKTASSSSSSASSAAGYKDGTFTGNTEYIPYGPVQISVVISGGKITDVNFLQMPSDLGYSRQVAAAAEPLLKQTTLQVQSANIDFVSGATSTSIGYQQSLQSALDKAAVSGSSSPSANSNSTGSNSGTTNPTNTPYQVPPTNGEYFDN